MSTPQEIASLLSKLIKYLYDGSHDDIENLLKNNEDAINAFTELKEEIEKGISIFQGLVDPNYDFTFIFTNYLKIFYVVLRDTPEDPDKFSQEMQEVIGRLSAHLQTKRALTSTVNHTPESKIEVLKELKKLFID